MSDGKNYLQHFIQWQLFETILLFQWLRTIFSNYNNWNNSSKTVKLKNFRQKHLKFLQFHQNRWISQHNILWLSWMVTNGNLILKFNYYYKFHAMYINWISITLWAHLLFYRGLIQLTCGKPNGIYIVLLHELRVHRIT